MTPSSPLALPVGLSVTSGLNAVAHAAEALYAPDTSPIIALMAEEGARALVTALPRIVADRRRPRRPRHAPCTAPGCAAPCLGATTMSLHHKLCHVLGGTLDLPHAQTHTVVLPYTVGLQRKPRRPPPAPPCRAPWAPTPPRPPRCGNSATPRPHPASLRELGDGRGRHHRRSSSRRWPTRTPTRARSPRTGSPPCWRPRSPVPLRTNHRSRPAPPVRAETPGVQAHVGSTRPPRRAADRSPWSRSGSSAVGSN